MSNFHITFTNPWLYFLLIPALALVLVPYFRLSKKYRRTRNRITSIVLSLLVMILSVSVLSGITFAYNENITSNEVILLVDKSHSNRDQEEKQNEFIKSVLDESGSSYQVGIVTFGYNQVYAAEMSNNIDRVYSQYLSAARPIDSATDVASALIYAKGLFTTPRAGRIVLISDGIETDGDALTAVLSVTSEGLQVDTVRFKENEERLATESPLMEVQLLEIKTPDYNVIAGDVAKIGVTLQTSYSGKATITIYDNGNEGSSIEVNMKEGIETFYIDHIFLVPGAHEIYCVIESEDDTLEQNNTYFSYLYLDVYDKVLIVERTTGESSKLETLLKDDYNDRGRPTGNVKVMNISSVPDTLDGLREYDQIILMNIADADMPEGFAEILQSYVSDIGGGLLTIGGNRIENGTEVANAYNRDDMRGTVYQSILPVECISYTPPTAVMIVIDRSGSMSSPSGIPNKNRLDMAKTGAFSCLEALSERDWVGVVSFNENSKVEIPLTPMTQRKNIEDAIYNIEMAGGTVFRGALEMAGSALMSLSGVERKHIMFVTDGEPSDPRRRANETEPMGYLDLIDHYYANGGITLSAVSISASGGAGSDTVKLMAEAGHGSAYDGINAADLPGKMREDLYINAIPEYIARDFTPTVRSWGSSELSGINRESTIPTLGGFYGTKVKRNAEVVLTGEYGVPIYAKWTYGKGKVGSFMSDLSGNWSSELLEDDEWSKLIHNIIRLLSPSESIRSRDLEVELRPDNYTSQLRIVPRSAQDGDKVEVTVTGPAVDGSPQITVLTADLAPSKDFFRCDLSFFEPGVYYLTAQQISSDGTYIGNSESFYAVFSYSAEYDVFVDPDEAVLFLEGLAHNGKGDIVSEASEIFKDFEKARSQTYDPRMILIIIAIVLFLLDVAVRKFKWKWPWEIVRDHRVKMQLKQHGKN